MVLGLAREDLKVEGVDSNHSAIQEIIIKNDEIGRKTIGITDESMVVIDGNIIFCDVAENNGRFMTYQKIVK